MTPKVRTAVIPWTAKNPYQDLLYDQLSGFGVSVLPGGRPGPIWAFRRRNDLDVLHLHWIESTLRGRRPLPTWVRAIRLLMGLTILRRARVRLVWTAHNIRPHEPRSPRIERLVFRAVAKMSDRVIVHSLAARAEFVEAFQRTHGVVVSPPGNFISRYGGAEIDRRIARQRLGLPPDGLIYLTFGRVNPYKRIDWVIREFRDLDDPDARLVIAGQPDSDELDELLRAISAADPRVILRLHRIDEEEVELYHAAADAAVLAYVGSFTSAALILALSLGLPAIVPAEGSALELARPPAVEPMHGDDLTNALKRIRSGGTDERRAAALRAAEALSWDQMAATLHDAYVS